MYRIVSWLLLAGLFTLLTLPGESTPEAGEAEMRPGDWFFAQRAFPYGRIDQRAYRQALQRRREEERQQEAAPWRNESAEWVSCGPTNTGGRVTDVEMPLASFEEIYVGTASGGIFYTADKGATWTPLFDEQPTLAIGDIAIAPSDERVLYVGTGEPNGGGGSITYDGMGVYKSTDGGATWEHLGLDSTGSIGKIVVHPDDPAIVYVGAMGRLFENNEQRGLYKSSDGGATWEQVLYLSDSTGVIDIAMHPGDPNILYAAAWERIRRPHARRYGGATSGIYRSNDGGRTWEELNGGLPDRPMRKGRIGLAIAPSDPDVLYAYYTNAADRLEGVFRSADGGRTWERKSTKYIAGTPFQWWFGKIYVHPENADHVYLTSLFMYESLNGGDDWEVLFSGVHVDQQALFVHPYDPDLIVLGNDGGVYLTENGGVTNRKLTGLPITQLYRCAVDYLEPGNLYGGTQDNGTIRTTAQRPDGWVQLFGGDGFVSLIDPTDNRYVYGESQYGRFQRSTDGGRTYQLAMRGIPTGEAKNWDTPVVFDPSNPSILYYGARRLYRSDDRALNWTPISPYLSEEYDGNLVFGTLTAIAVSPLDPGVIFAGTDDGRLWRTLDGGANWRQVNAGLPQRWVTSITCSSDAVASAYVTFSGYRYGERLSQVYRTMDGGDSWEDIGSSLPDIPVNDLLAFPGGEQLIVATDVGAFRSTDGGGQWEILGAGMPAVVVTDLTYHEPTETLFAASYGRSLFKMSVGPLSTDTADPGPGHSTSGSVLSAAPNPFSGKTYFKLQVQESQWYRFVLIDQQGRVVRTIHRGDLEAGRYELEFNGRTLTPGYYVAAVFDGRGQQIAAIRMVKQ